MTTQQQYQQQRVSFFGNSSSAFMSKFESKFEEQKNRFKAKAEQYAEKAKQLEADFVTQAKQLEEEIVKFGRTPTPAPAQTPAQKREDFYQQQLLIEQQIEMERLEKRIRREQEIQKRNEEMVEEARQRGLQVVRQHLITFLEERNQNATYREWIADLHPENATFCETTGNLLEIDNRFLIPGNPWAKVYHEQTRSTTTTPTPTIVIPPPAAIVCRATSISRVISA